MKDHLSSTETGVFRDTITMTTKGLHNNIDRWALDLKPVLMEREKSEEEEDGGRGTCETGGMEYGGKAGRCIDSDARDVLMTRSPRAKEE